MKTKKAEVTVAASKGKLGNIKGHSVISVMRAMGKHGWKYEEMKPALEARVGQEGLLLLPAEHTMRLALKRGRDAAAGVDIGKGRRIAPLSKKELEELRVTPKAKGKKSSKKTPAPEKQAENVEALLQDAEQEEAVNG